MFALVDAGSLFLGALGIVMGAVFVVPLLLKHVREMAKIRRGQGGAGTDNSAEIDALSKRCDALEKRCEELQLQVTDAHAQLADERRQLDLRLANMLPAADSATAARAAVAQKTIN